MVVLGPDPRISLGIYGSAEKGRWIDVSVLNITYPTPFPE
jgi:hypothetical protein